jgi:CubicO group peptidase (beta-lactamase class C family)
MYYSGTYGTGLQTTSFVMNFVDGLFVVAGETETAYKMSAPIVTDTEASFEVPDLGLTLAGEVVNTRERGGMIIGKLTNAKTSESSSVQAVHCSGIDHCSPSGEFYNIADLLRLTMTPGLVKTTYSLGESSGGMGSIIADPEALDYHKLVHLKSWMATGELTKLITATCIARLVDEGYFTYASTLAELFGARMIPEPYAGVTVSQLLSHRSGLPSRLTDESAFLPSPVGQKNANATRLDYVREVLKLAPVASPGSADVFSDAGYVVLGAIVDRFHYDGYEDFADAAIKAVSGYGAGVYFGCPGQDGVDEPTRQNVTEPVGHYLLDGAEVPLLPTSQAFCGQPAALNSALGALLQVTPLAEFLKSHVYDTHQFLDPETRADMHKAHFDGGAYGYGVTVDIDGLTSVVGPLFVGASSPQAPRGAHAAWSAAVLFDRESRFVYSKILNSGHSAAAADQLNRIERQRDVDSLALLGLV